MIGERIKVYVAVDQQRFLTKAGSGFVSECETGKPGDMETILDYTTGGSAIRLDREDHDET